MKFFIEFTGVLILVFTALLTDRNPVAMGFMTFAVFSLGKQYNAHFSPLYSAADWWLGRIPSKESLLSTLANWGAVAFALIALSPIKTFIKHVES